MSERTWEITDLDGSNRRTVTLAQYRAEIDAARIEALGHFRKCKKLGVKRYERIEKTAD
jgi:hypothetical protein